MKIWTHRNIMWSIEFWIGHSTPWTICGRAFACAPYAQTDPVIEYKREGFDMFFGHERRN